MGARRRAGRGSAARKFFNLQFDPADQPPGEFLTGSEAWLRCRAGQEDPDEFGIFDEHGLWFIFGDLLLDLAALNKTELLPWDSRGAGGGPDWDPTPAELEAVDDLAGSSCPMISRRSVSGTGRCPVPRRIFTFVGGSRLPVDLGDLVTT